METLTTTLNDSSKLEKHLDGLERARSLMDAIKKCHARYHSANDIAGFKHALGLYIEARLWRMKAKNRLAVYYRLWASYRKVTKNLYHG